MVHRPHSFQNEGKLRALDVFNPLSAGILHHLVPSQQPVFVFFWRRGGGGEGGRTTPVEKQLMHLLYHQDRPKKN